MAGTPRTLRLQHDQCVVVWDNVFIWSCRGPAHVPDAEFAHRQLQQLSAQYPEGIAFFLRVPHRAPLPDGPFRERAARMFKEMAPNMLAVCTVFEGKGFWASTARSIMAGITIMIRGFRVKVAGEPSEAVPWVHNQLMSAGAASFTEEEFLAMLDDIERRIDEFAAQNTGA